MRNSTLKLRPGLRLQLSLTLTTSLPSLLSTLAYWPCASTLRPAKMLTPTLSRFLSETAGVLRSRDADKLCQYLVIEPPYPQIYEQLRAEIRSTYNAQDRTALQRLETVCSDQLSAVLTDPEGNAPTWTAFTKFMAQYFIFLRDVDVSNLLATYELLSEVLQ